MSIGNKKSQITVFMIIGIILVAIGGFVFFIYSSQKTAVESPSESLSVKSYFEECSKSRLEHGLNLLGAQGGYISMPDSYLRTNYSNIAYGLYGKKNTLPSISAMENELEEFMDAAMASCANSSAFPYLKFEYGNSSTDAEILENEVVLNVKFPVSVIQGESVTNFDEFKVKVPVRLGYIHSILTGAVKKTLLEPNWIDLAYLSSFGLKIDILPYDNNSIVYSVQDYKGTKPYVFLSAFSIRQNLAPVINAEGNIRLPDGQLFLKKLNVTDPEGDVIECSDDTALFDITHDCIILFTPEIPGRYNVGITATDAFGNEARKNIIFEVI